MMVRKPTLSKILALASVVLWAAGCADEAPDVLPSVNSTGPHSVFVGSTITVGGETTDGEDSGYTFASGNEAVATVDEAGIVTGAAPGEVDITVTGVDTGASATHPLVVLNAQTDPAEIPFFEAWILSGHADRTAEAYTHFDEDGEVRTSCAKCHASSGFLDFVGADGSVPNQVDNPAPVGDVVRCETCHSPGVLGLDSVEFPSGVVVSDLGKEAICMTCHQGRSSTNDVNDDITDAMVVDDDTPDEDLRFINQHYYPAGATLYASRVAGGYQYDGLDYDARFRHVPGYDTCTGCHDAHTLEVKFDECSTCHAGVTDGATARGIRMVASMGNDYDGDGNTTEGINEEIITLQEKLLATIQQYAQEQGAPICYGTGYPYFFKDTNGNGSCDGGEDIFPNQYDQWTARLLRAAFNYQMAAKDPGKFAHNAKYTIQLLYDAIADMAPTLAAAPVDPSTLTRTDVGHFNGASDAAAFFQANDTIRSSCSACHSGAPGYRFYLQYDVGIEVPDTANGLECFTCHESFAPDYDVLEVTATNFSGEKIDMRENDGDRSNLCGNCHAGRNSGATIDAHIDSTGGDNTMISFQNVHYLAAAGSTMGTEAGVGYEYVAQMGNYVGKFDHFGETAPTQCTGCHVPSADNHSFKVEDSFDACLPCHASANGDPKNIQITHTADYDADGMNESVEDELAGLNAELLAAMQTLADICWGPSYPYFFVDTDMSGGECDPGEAIFPNQFNRPFNMDPTNVWTPELLRAAHNYQFTREAYGAWVHNFDYHAQLIYDSIEDLTAATPMGPMGPLIAPGRP